jgi:hypothetical protein
MWIRDGKKSGIRDGKKSDSTIKEIVRLRGSYSTVWIMGVRTRIQTKVIMKKIVKLKNILTKNAIYAIYFILNS